MTRTIFRRAMLFFAALLTLSAFVNSYSIVADRARSGNPLDLWRPMVWEFSSVLLLWLLIPAVAWLLGHFPLRRDNWWRSLPAHVLATVPFSLAHTLGMVLLRKIAYRIAGERYDFGPFWDNWLYEYRKDFFVYALIVAALSAFTIYSLWLQTQSRTEGQAAGLPPLTVAADAASDPAPPLDRLVVRKRNREFILDAADIDRLESDGNYVNIHTAGESYRLRDSLEGLHRRLGEKRFARVHRAHVVNIDRIREIQPWDNGDYRIVLKDGSFVNFSRRYRGRLDRLFR